MKSNLLKEMEQVIENKKFSIDFPIPCYLFIQKYGRTVQNELQEIICLFGKENYFCFKTEASLKEETIQRRFMLEENRHTGLGKKYVGGVLIELTGEEDERELFELLDYLDRNRERISCLFTTKSYHNADHISKHLEQFFFVRVIAGAEYEVQEQLALFEEKLGNYHFELSDDAVSRMREFFEQKVWEESDMVEKRILNLVSDIVYSRILTEAEDSTIEEEEVSEALQKIMKHTEKRNTIGFVIV